MTQKLSEVILSSDNCRRCRAWCFTCNNYGEKDEERARSLGNTCEYFIMGFEGVDKTPHLQGYLYFKNARSFTSVQKKLTQKFHLEVARGNANENKSYCSKEGNFIEVGTVPNQGQRIDINKFVNDIEDGLSDEELWKNHPECMVKYRKAKDDRRNSAMGKKNRECPEIKVMIGPPGCGKTRSVVEAEPKLWSAPGNYDWFDGYCGQEAVLFDDFEGEIEYRFLLKLLDRYKMQVPIKGGFVWWVPKRIYITSNIAVGRWYGRKNIDALERRLKEFEMNSES